jgi:hypothetical protein
MSMGLCVQQIVLLNLSLLYGTVREAGVKITCVPWYEVPLQGPDGVAHVEAVPTLILMPMHKCCDLRLAVFRTPPPGC